ncbi:hypothetical protein ACFQ38_05560 [Sporosarcina contaminans]|uniref:Fungalysin/Thermolysin Propeptide Motif n=1 Tax=Sporosarcina contaminans TaxID=633403 RepID=A0ABW3TVN5_9BACL
MKKLFATTLSAVLLTTGGFGAANALHTDKVEAATPKYESTYANHDARYQSSITANELKQLPEYATVASKINVNGLTAKVTENNSNKRIILFTDARGQGKYKSIFVKKTNSLKVIDFRGGEIFFGTVKLAEAVPGTSTESTPEATKPESKPVTDQNSTLAEYAKLSSVVNVKNFNMQVVEDNASKRIITLKDQNGRVQYKSIFMKRTNMLKVINTRGGQVFYGSVK